jgi:hypothetical protein
MAELQALAEENSLLLGSVDDLVAHRRESLRA